MWCTFHYSTWQSQPCLITTLTLWAPNTGRSPAAVSELNFLQSWEGRQQDSKPGLNPGSCSLCQLTRTSALVPRNQSHRKSTFSFQRAFLIAGRKLLDRTWLWHFPSCCWTLPSVSLLWFPLDEVTLRQVVLVLWKRPGGVNELTRLSDLQREFTRELAGKKAICAETPAFSLTQHRLQWLCYWNRFIHEYRHICLVNIYLTPNANINNNRDENDNSDHM